MVRCALHLGGGGARGAGRTRNAGLVRLVGFRSAGGAGDCLRVHSGGELANLGERVGELGSVCHLDVVIQAIRAANHEGNKVGARARQRGLRPCQAPPR